jgi:hypothetical protein
VLEELAATAIGLDEPRRAARLLAAAGSVRRAIATPIPICERVDHEETVAAVGGRLPRTTLAADLRTGRRTALDRIDSLIDGPDREPSTGSHTQV